MPLPSSFLKRFRLPSPPPPSQFTNGTGSSSISIAFHGAQMAPHTLCRCSQNKRVRSSTGSGHEAAGEIKGARGGPGGAGAWSACTSGSNVCAAHTWLNGGFGAEGAQNVSGSGGGSGGGSGRGQLFLGSKPRPQRLLVRRSSRQWCAVQCMSRALRQVVTTSVAQGRVEVGPSLR